jgi:PAS domain S-box-containing protein
MESPFMTQDNERWLHAIQGCNDGVWDWNPGTGKAFFSERWKTMLGYAPVDIGNHVNEWTSRIHPDDLPWVMAAVQRHLRGETAFYQTEHRLQHRLGHYLWVLDRGQAHFNAAAEPVRMIGLHIDVTEQHRMKEILHDRTEELNTIVNLSPDGVVTFDRQNRVKYASPAFHSLTGLTSAQVEHLSESDFWLALAERCSNGLYVLGFGQTLKPQGDSSTPVRQLLSFAGSPARTVDVRRQLSESAAVSCILCFRDVTHESEVDRLKSEFLCTAAHELRTPLASVFGFAEILLTQENDQASQREFLEIVYQQAQQMSSILNELLDLARIEARRGKDFSIATISTQALVQQVVNNFKVPDKRKPPVLSLPELDLLMQADKTKAGQALLNVVANAYKFSPAGGDVLIEVKKVLALNGGAMAGIRVTDSGIGMTPEQMSRLFERFYRADFSGKIPGTGLGMSIVKEIIDLHHGLVEVQSKPGEGTSVCLLLPLSTDWAPT